MKTEIRKMEKIKSCRCSLHQTIAHIKEYCWARIGWRVGKNKTAILGNLMGNEDILDRMYRIASVVCMPITGGKIVD